MDLKGSKERYMGEFGGKKGKGEMFNYNFRSNKKIYKKKPLIPPNETRGFNACHHLAGL